MYVCICVLLYRSFYERKKKFLIIKKKKKNDYNYIIYIQENTSKHTYTCITQLRLTILKGCLGTSE